MDNVTGTVGEAGTTDGPVARAVRSGLSRGAKSLPPWLFYDTLGSEQFERITELPEYYLTRAEREIFQTHADAIVELAAGTSGEALRVVELGAGTATKSQVLLRAVVRRQRRCLFVPVDVSGAALDIAQRRLAREEPNVEVRPLVLSHEEAARRLSGVAPKRFVLFIGSSIGNFDEPEAVALLSRVRRGLAAGDALLLGADRRKCLERLLPAYDDAAGVTAAFNKNVLARINCELGGEFDLDAFEHVALWNDELSRVEMHLESKRAQRVRIAELRVTVSFAEGERIHTESSHKYSDDHVRELLTRSGFCLERTFTDREQLFGVHVARVSGD
jgi:dimethylhistidine N-methyltransferase